MSVDTHWLARENPCYFCELDRSRRLTTSHVTSRPFINWTRHDLLAVQQDATWQTSRNHVCCTVLHIWYHFKWFAHHTVRPIVLFPTWMFAIFSFNLSPRDFAGDKMTLFGRRQELRNCQVAAVEFCRWTFWSFLINMKSPALYVIAAACNNRGIGKNNNLPWSLPKEFAHFQHMTRFTAADDPSKKNVVIMGKNTWLSIPAKHRPLKDRINIIVSSSLDANARLGAHYIARTFDDALQLLSTPDISKQVYRVWVIGGMPCIKQRSNRRTFFVCTIRTWKPISTATFSFPNSMLAEWNLLKMSRHHRACRWRARFSMRLKCTKLWTMTASMN